MSRFAQFFVALTVVALLIAGCAPAPAPAPAPAQPAAPAAAQPTQAPAAAAAAPAAGGKTIGVLVAGTNVPYLATYARVIKETAAKSNAKVVLLDANFESDRQAQQMDDLISQKPDVIILNAVDAAAIVPALKKANDAKIPVVASNNGVDKSATNMIEGYTGPDDYMEGGLAGELMAAALKNKGNVVMIEGAMGTTPQINRAAGFLDTLKKIAPDIKLLDKQTGRWDRETSRQVAADFITRYGDQINGIFGHDDTEAMGAADAVKAAGKQDKIIVVGLGGSETGLKGVKEGQLYGTMLQSPVLDAQMAVEAALKVANGEKIPATNYLKIPKITKDNVDQFTPEW
jgi:ribose transport system substrate-binding protein